MVQLRNNFAFGLGRGEVTQGKRTREKRKKEGESGDEERATMGKLGGNTQMRESFCPLSSSRPVTEPVCKTGMPPTIPPGHWKLSPPPLPPPPPSPGYLFRRIKSHSPPFLIWGSPTICGDFPSPRGPSFPHWESSSLAVRCRPSCKVGEQILRWLCCGCNTFKCTWTVKHFHLGDGGTTGSRCRGSSPSHSQQRYLGCCQRQALAEVGRVSFTGPKQGGKDATKDLLSESVLP